MIEGILQGMWRSRRTGSVRLLPSVPRPIFGSWLPASAFLALRPPRSRKRAQVLGSGVVCSQRRTSVTPLEKILGVALVEERP